LPVDEAIDYVCQAAKGLGYVHSQGVVHRNVKPKNLLLDGDGTVHVTNMTLAMILDEAKISPADMEQLTKNGQMLGTSDYCAPEQAIDAHSADHRSDIYSLGCTLYFLLTGKTPYPAEHGKKAIAHLTSPIPSLRDVRDDVPEEMDRVFQNMLAKSPEDRPSSMKEVAGRLRRSLFASGSVAGRRRGFGWELLALMLLIGLLVGGLAVGALMASGALIEAMYS